MGSENITTEKRCYRKVSMPGGWYYTDDPPSRWRIVLAWCIGVPLVIWPVTLLLLFFAAVFLARWMGLIS